MLEDLKAANFIHLASLDAQGAFDTAPHPELKKAMEKSVWAGILRGLDSKT